MRQQEMSYLVCGAAALAFAVPATAATHERYFDLRPQGANHSLPEFARQAGLEIKAPGAALRDIRTRDFKGRFEVRQAFEYLTQGAGNEALSVKGAAIVLAPRKVESKTAFMSSEQQHLARKDYAIDLKNLVGVLKPQHANSQSLTDPRFDEIIVTARRREESLQDVPVSIQAFSETEIRDRNLNSVEDLAIQTPSMVFTRALSSEEISSSLAIRGQGNNTQGNPGVVTYFAEVPNLNMTNFYTFTEGRSGSFYDMASVQVLKGPQGTLFGKNATGGNVLFVPQKPTNQFEGSMKFQAGNYEDRGFDGILNVPIVDEKLLLRVAVSTESRNGYTKDVGPFFKGRDYDDLDYRAARVSLVLRPTDTFENYTIARYRRSKTNGGAAVLTGYDPDAPTAFGVPVGALFPNLLNYLSDQQARGIRKVAVDTPSYNYSRLSQIINTSTLDILPNLKIKNIISYAVYKSAFGYDIDASTDNLAAVVSTPFTRAAKTRSWTEEFQAQGTISEALTYTVGLYGDKIASVGPFSQFLSFFPASGGFFPPLPAGEYPGFTGPGPIEYPLFLVNTNSSRSSRAAYGEATLNFGIMSNSLEGLSLTAGYRHTWDKGKNSVGTYTVFGGALSPGSFKFDYGSHNVSLSYHVSPQILIYGSERTAFKAGGFNGSLPKSSPAYQFPPEKYSEVEIGVKSNFDLAGVPVRANLAAYRGNYTNIQRTVRDPDISLFSSFIRPVAEARIKGLEFSGSVAPSAWLDLDFNYAYTEAKYTKVDDPLLSGILDSKFAFTPRHKYGLSAAFKWLFVPESIGTVRTAINYAYQAKQNISNNAALGDIFVPGYGIANLRADWRNVGGSRLSAGFFMTNITNKKYIAGGAIEGQRFAGYEVRGYGAPRMFGFELSVRFGE